MYGGDVGTSYVHIFCDYHKDTGVYRAFFYVTIMQEISIKVGFSDMTIYSGEVSHKKELGRVRTVTATDNLRLAHAFGVTGVAGATYSNGKIGMLQLEGGASHAEVAIDPTEMTQSNDYDYLLAHYGAVQDKLASAEVFNQYDPSRVKQVINQFVKGVSFRELSNDERVAVVDYAMGATDEKTVRDLLTSTDDLQRVTDSVRSALSRLRVERNGEVGGVLFSVGLSLGDIDVKQTPAQQRVQVHYNVQTRVLGSASSAGKAYKDSFKEIKSTLINEGLAITETPREYILPDDTIDAKLDDVTFRVKDDMRHRLREYLGRVADKFADVPPFNPASSLAKLWSELGITSTDVAQTRLSMDAIKAYAEGEIDAVQFAELPENGMAQKLALTLTKRLESADVDALTEQALDRFDMPATSQNTALVREKVSSAIADVAGQIGAETDVLGLLEMYNLPNKWWVNEILEHVQLNTQPVDPDALFDQVEERLFNSVMATVPNADSDTQDFIRKLSYFGVKDVLDDGRDDDVLAYVTANGVTLDVAVNAVLVSGGFIERTADSILNVDLVNHLVAGLQDVLRDVPIVSFVEQNLNFVAQYHNDIVALREFVGNSTY